MRAPSPYCHHPSPTGQQLKTNAPLHSLPCSATCALCSPEGLHPRTLRPTLFPSLAFAVVGVAAPATSARLLDLLSLCPEVIPLAVMCLCRVLGICKVALQLHTPHPCVVTARYCHSGCACCCASSCTHSATWGLVGRMGSGGGGSVFSGLLDHLGLPTSPGTPPFLQLQQPAKRASAPPPPRHHRPAPSVPQALPS